MTCCDDLFGGLFDLNGDGDTDPGEMILGLHILDELQKEEEEEEDGDE